MVRVREGKGWAMSVLRKSIAPVIHTRVSLEAMREDAAKAIEAKLTLTWQPDILKAEDVQRQAENMIAIAIADRALYPPCPWCGGPVLDRPTQGTKQCIDCGSICLRGNQ